MTDAEMQETLYGLIVQAREMQKFPLEFRAHAQDVLNKLPEGAKSAIRDAAGEILISDAKTASRGISEAAKTAQEACADLRGTWRTGLWFALGQFAMGLIIGAAVFAFFTWQGNRDRAELDEVRAAIRREQHTLNEIQSKTWGIVLQQYTDGRGIILPQGVTGRIAKGKDGRSIVVLE